MLGFENQAFYFTKLYMNKNHYKHYYTNGSIDKLCSECPIGFWLGRTYKQSKETKEKIKLGVLKSLPNRKIVSHNIHGGKYHDIVCESGWELCFLIYCIDHNIKIERCKDYFKYKLEGLEYKFFFYLHKHGYFRQHF